MVETVTQWFEFHLVDDFIDKGKLKEEFSFFSIDTTLLHIEESGIIELSNCRAMITLNIISIDLKHWLREHSGSLAGTKVTVILL